MSDPRSDHDALLESRLEELREEWKSWHDPDRIEEHRVQHRAELLRKLEGMRRKGVDPARSGEYQRALDDWTRWGNPEWLRWHAEGRRCAIEHEAATLRGDRQMQWPSPPVRDEDDERWSR